MSQPIDIEAIRVDRWKDGYAAAERQIAGWERGPDGYARRVTP